MSVPVQSPNGDYSFDDDVLYARLLGQARNSAEAPSIEGIDRLMAHGRYRYAKEVLDHYADPGSQARVADLEWKIGQLADGMQRCRDQAARVPTDYDALDRLAGMAFVMSDMATARECVIAAVERGLSRRDHVIRMGIEACWITGSFDEGDHLLAAIYDTDLRSSLATSLQQSRGAAKALSPEFLDPDFNDSIRLCEKAIAAGDVAQATAIARARILFGSSHREIMTLGRKMHDLGSPNWIYFFWGKFAAAERFPNDPEAILGLASMLIQRGDVDEGARLLSTVAAIEGPQAPETTLLLTFCKAAGAQVTDDVLASAVACAEGHRAPSTALGHRWLAPEEKEWSAQPHEQVADDLEIVRRNMPPAKGRKPRIAVCISGQLRSFFTTWETTAKTLEPWDPVVFLSTWDNIGVGLGAHNTIDRVLPHQIRQALTYDARHRAKFEQLFPTLFQSMIAIKRVNPKGLQDFSGIQHIRVHSEQAFDAEFGGMDAIKLNGSLNQPKMFATLTDVNDLKSRYEREHDMVFDAVLRIRPDRALGILSPDDVERVCCRPIVITDYFLPGGVGDQVMISSSAVSNVIASIWPNMRDAGRPNFFEGATGRLNEFLLAEYIMANRIAIGRFEGTSINQITAPVLSVAEIWDDAATDFLNASDNMELRRTFTAIHDACYRTGTFAPDPEKAKAVSARLLS